VLINVTVQKPKKIEKLSKVVNSVKEAEKRLKGGRILVRPSGTVPKIRIMVEGDDMKKIKNIAEEVAEVIKTEMG